MHRPTARVGARRGVGGRAGRRRAQDAVAVRARLGRRADLRRAGLGRGLRAARPAAQRGRRRARAAARRRRALHRRRRHVRASAAPTPGRAPSATTSSSTPRRCWPRSATTSRSGWRCSRADLATGRASGPPSPVGPFARRSSTFAIAARSSPSHSSACCADQPHRPGQRVRPGPGHPGVDQRVEHDPLGLAQPRHHRHRRVVNSSTVLAQPRAPGDLALVAVLGLAGDLDALVAGGPPGSGDAPAAAAARSARPASVRRTRPPARGSSPTIMISSRSTVTSGAPTNQPSGSRPASHAATSVGRRAGRPAAIRPARAPARRARPARATARASVRSPSPPPRVLEQRLRDYTATRRCAVPAVFARGENAASLIERRMFATPVTGRRSERDVRCRGRAGRRGQRAEGAPARSSARW